MRFEDRPATCPRATFTASDPCRMRGIREAHVRSDGWSEWLPWHRRGTRSLPVGSGRGGRPALFEIVASRTGMHERLEAVTAARGPKIRVTGLDFLYQAI